MKEVCPIRRFTFDPEVEDERLLTLHYLCNEIRRREVPGEVISRSFCAAALRVRPLADPRLAEAGVFA